MFNLKSKFRFIMPVLIFSAMPLIAEEVPNYATADVIVSMDKKDNNKKSSDSYFAVFSNLKDFKYLNQMSKCGIQYAVMEVSAHAIALNKIDAVDEDRKNKVFAQFKEISDDNSLLYRLLYLLKAES